MNAEPDVLIVGAGPAGLSAARTLKNRGVENVLVVDREHEAGGIPRFCPHPTFGLADFYRPMSGPAYAAKLRSLVDPGWIAGSTTVTAIDVGLETTVSSELGERTLRPRRILLATGIRETPRAARLVSGDRPRNVLTTGALQRLLAENHHLPFSRPVIVGTELVSFSALLSLRDAGVRALAMIEAGSRIVARKPADVLARLFLGTAIHCNSRILSINSADDNAAKMTSVSVEEASGQRMQIECDAVIFTGGFVPEASLLGHRPDLRDAGSKGPAIDQCWRLGDSGIYAAGNILRSVETAGWSAREGALAAEAIALHHFSTAPAVERRIPIRTDEPVAFSTPSFISFPGPALGPLHVAVRMKRACRGKFTFAADGKVFWRSPTMTAMPERRILLSRHLPKLDNVSELQIGFEMDRRA